MVCRKKGRVAPKPSSRSPRQRLVAHLSYKPPNLWILHKLFKCNFLSFIMSKTKSSRSKEKLFFSRQKELFFAPRYSVASVMIMIYYTGPWQKKRYVWNRWAINTGWSRMLKMKTKKFGFWGGKLVLPPTWSRDLSQMCVLALSWSWGCACAICSFVSFAQTN